ncbi:MAG: organic solvent tolerance protein [Bdellovibrionota bacterium]
MFRNGIRIIAFVFLLVALMPIAAEAKDLSNRLGIGYKNQFGADVPGVAVQYWPGAELGLSATLGVDTQQTSSRFGAMVKLYRVVFQEDNMNFYMGAGTGLLSQEVSGRTDSGFELMGFGGSEFFLPGLENLGFSFEVGVAVTSLSNGVRFRTFGDHPLRAGIMFYF